MKRMWPLLGLVACGSPPALAPAPTPASTSAAAAVAPSAKLEPAPHHALVAHLEFAICAVAPDGHIKCWHHQIPPYDIPQLPADERIVALAGGDDHDRLCALTEQRVFCWNLRRQKGQPLPAPARIAPLLAPTDVAIDEDHGCAVATGRVACWTWKDREPRDIGVKNAVAVWIDDIDSCALDRDGAVWCWSGADGTATLVPDVPPAARLSEGGDPCAVLQDGRVICWEMVKHLPSAYAEPVILDGVEDAVGFASSERTSCVLHADGGVSCGGSNQNGALGRGTLDEGPLERVAGLKGINQLVAHEARTCARDEAGSTWCWGSYVSYRDPNTPMRVDRPHLLPKLRARQVSAGIHHTCAIDTEGHIWCWGDERALADAELSDPPLRAAWNRDVGPEGWIAYPQRIHALRASSLASSGYSCTVTPDKRVRCWGGFDVDDVNDALAETPAVNVATGYGYACALDGQGSISSCAGDADWRRPIGACVPADFPAWKPRFHRTDLVGLSHSGGQLCGLTSNSVVCYVRGWQRGPTKVDCDTYARYELNLKLSRVAAAQRHACGIDKSGGVQCWTVDHPSPAPVTGIAGARKLGIGEQRGCALDSAGAVYCWSIDALRAEPVPSLPPVKGLSVGNDHACGWHEDGRLWCWGSNEYGQVGKGDRQRDHLLRPTRIVEVSP